ncbi:MAG: DUF2087 domain-containing protein [Candidatus Muiribacteriota bacterium]|jgi:hypothetical protein
MKKVDEVYTPDFIEKIWGNYTENNYLKAIPVKRKKRLAVFLKILDEFNFSKKYSEKEVNEIIQKFHEDYCLIRREMVEEGFMDRKDGIYWRREFEIHF